MPLKQKSKINYSKFRAVDIKKYSDNKINGKQVFTIGRKISSKSNKSIKFTNNNKKSKRLFRFDILIGKQN